MARKIKVDMTGVEAYSKVNEGIHAAKIVEVEQTQSQAGDDMITVAYDVTAGPDKGGRVFDNFVLTQKALWKLKVLLKALGMKCDGRLIVDLDRLIGKACDIEVFHDEYNGQIRAKISDYYKLGTHSTPESTTDVDDDVDEDEDEEEIEEAPKKTKKAPAKKSVKKAEPEQEEDEEEDDDWEDDEEEEEEEPAPRKRRAPAKKAPAKKAPAKRKKPEPEPEEEDDDEDEWEEDDE